MVYSQRWYYLLLNFSLCIEYKIYEKPSHIKWTLYQLFFFFSTKKEQLIAEYCANK